MTPPALPPYVPDLIDQYVTIETLVGGNPACGPWGCAGSVWYDGPISLNFPRPVGYPITATGNKTGTNVEFEGMAYLTYALSASNPGVPVPVTSYIVKGTLYDIIGGTRPNPRQQLGAIDLVGDPPTLEKKLILSSDYFVDRAFTPQADWEAHVYAEAVWTTIVFDPPPP